MNRSGFPQRVSDNVSILTKACGSWYISDGSGQKIISAPRLSQSLLSRSKSLGYASKSSVGPNWVGFTKSDTTTISFSSLHFLIRLACPHEEIPLSEQVPQSFLLFSML